ncbi:hypothetical protein EF847_07570 [Actinobacteria bacterium YIM 96077]|uniref:Helix-hairpin-helix domain-containing protein n=1 Tax=Phytoactinopolyspora halophila TaxID=1981511 RepID=A0A329QJS0_9ACTN|nr:helix-hairpin-helix domain-containing protein [Phytoactinopolyspora halophila]AYY12584.1 hypothetical protein EF847_07570 [Actinobacteria bacterium YIM 96077]RAW12513.1 hypothetical protein DPM12_14020 [Phytoactinopolyspora halophila]
MTTQPQLRKTAMTFPEVDEHSEEGTEVFSVRGEEFASITKEGIVRLRLPSAEAEDAVAAYPRAERLVHAGSTVGFQAPLADVDGQHLWSLVMTAWKHRAPEQLAAGLDAIVASPTRPDSELPAGIGKVATRALAVAGLTTLDQIAACTKAELLALHGVGPKAVRILADTLADQGMSLR